jgi:hypothetical protein
MTFKLYLSHTVCGLSCFYTCLHAGPIPMQSGDMVRISLHSSSIPNDSTIDMSKAVRVTRVLPSTRRQLEEQDRQHINKVDLSHTVR